MQNLQAIILAAGKSKRLNANKTKLLEKICGQEMILYPTKLLQEMSIPTTVVIGFQKESIKKIITKCHKEPIHFVVQEEQRGSGHAILCARDSWQEEHILIMHGDLPLVTKEIIEKLYQKHLQTNAEISFVTACNIDPTSGAYNRVIKKDNSINIVAASKFTGDTTEHCCINAGIYIVTKKFLHNNINEIEPNEISKEFYVADLVNIANNKGSTISMLSAQFDRIRGINTFEELWAAEQVKRAELIKYWMERGVRFSVAQNVHIDLDVTIESGTSISCGVHLLNGTKIGKNCKIQEFSSLSNATIEDGAKILAHSIIKDSHIGQRAQVGPFAHIREHTHIREHAIIGNFVEIKNSTIGEQTKAKHLTYLGDANIGSHVNIGAGTITCNHDGTTKQKTVIKDNAYIGSNNSLVAPVTIEQNAFTAAGSTITHDVPADALAIARCRQTNKEGYAKKLRKTDEHGQEKKEQAADALSFIGAVKTSNDTINT